MSVPSERPVGALSYPVVAPDDVAWITEADMVEVDRVMIDDLHIELLQMMENAGRNLARLVLDLVRPASVAVAAGSGGNGGGGLVAARHLTNAG
jgi:NAD(P)H-hydrate epimerase